MAVIQGFIDLERFVRREQKKKISSPQPENNVIPTTIQTTQAPINHTIQTPINNLSASSSPNDTTSSPLSTSHTIHSLEDIIAAFPAPSEHGQSPTAHTEPSVSPSEQPQSNKPEVINLDSLLSGLEKTWHIQSPHHAKPTNTFSSPSVSRPGRSAKALGITMIAGGVICLGGLLYFYIITTNPLLFEDKATITQASTESTMPSIADSLSQPLTNQKKVMTALTPFNDAVGANDAETTINVLDIMDMLDSELRTIQSNSGTEKRLQSTATILLKNLHTARTILDESPHNPNREEINTILTKIQTIYKNTIKEAK